MAFRKCLSHLPALERRRIATPPGIRMRLNRLEMQVPYPAGTLEQIRASLDLRHLEHYPDYRPFYARLAEYVDHPVERLVVGAGIEEFIRMLMALEERAIVLQSPTCAMHRVYGDAFRSRLVLLESDPRRRTTVDDVLAKLDSGVGLLLWANPGQPVQDYFTLAELERIARRCAALDIVFAIDEAYAGFGAESALPLVHTHPNVIVLGTFSKAFGLASCRIGFAVAQRPLIGFLDAVRQSGEVASLSMQLATWAMDHPAQVEKRCVRVIMGRETLRARMAAIGVRTYGDWGNSLLLDCRSSQTKLMILEQLAARGILVRDALPTCLMVTCGGPELMNEFADEFEGIAGKCQITFSNGTPMAGSNS